MTRGELIAALSLATDLGTGQPMDHALRTCIVGVELARRAGLDDSSVGAVYFGALLRSVGCTADAHEQGAIFGDELAARHDLALVAHAPIADVVAVLRRRVGAG